MPMLLVKVEGRTLRFDSFRLIRIGRSIEADVVLSPGSVSRQHAELRPVPGGWMLVDASSQYGTFVDGRRVNELRITGPVTVQCGPEPAARIEVLPEPSSQDVPAASAPAPVPPLPSATVMPPVPEPPTMPPSAAPPGARPTGVVAPPPHQPTSVAGRGPSAAPPPVRPPAPPVQQPVQQPVPPPFASPGPPPPSGPPVPPPVGPGAGFDETRVIAAIPPGPGFHAPRTGPDLLVVAEGREYRYRHPAQVTVGRQPDCGIVISDPACSRIHGTIAAVPGGWVFANHSAEGTFDAGRRVDNQRFEGRTALRLGHPVAGPELMLVPILSAAEEERRFARKRRRKVLLMVGAAAAVLLLVIGTVAAAVLLSGRDDTPVAGAPAPSSTDVPPTSAGTPNDLSEDELESAKAATVLIVAEAPDTENGGTVEYSGSGSIITKDGLILTNAHVAKPTAPGLAEYYGDDGIGDPDYLLIALTNSMDDSVARPAYRARPLEVDGRSDAAVIEIYADAQGDPVDPADLDLPVMALGDSDELRSGDDVTVLGFPGIAESRRITVTTGVISTFLDRDDLGERSEIDTDARIAPGNSGGAAVNNDAELIGIPTALFAPDGSPVVSGRIRPINIVRELVEDAEQGN